MLSVLPLQTNLSINVSSPYTKSTVPSSIPEVGAPKEVVAAAASRPKPTAASLNHFFDLTRPAPTASSTKTSAVVDLVGNSKQKSPM